MLSAAKTEYEKSIFDAIDNEDGYLDGALTTEECKKFFQTLINNLQEDKRSARGPHKNVPFFGSHINLIRYEQWLASLDPSKE